MEIQFLWLLNCIYFNIQFITEQFFLNFIHLQKHFEFLFYQHLIRFWSR